MRAYSNASWWTSVGLFSGLIGAIGLSIFASESAVAQEEEHPVELLFVQNAHGVTYDKETSTMTLQRISPVVTFFSDRPNRVVGHVRLAGFLDAWDDGEDSFEEDPPNASLSILDHDEIKTVIVELLNPRISGDDFVYDVIVLDGHLPESGGSCSLFIDGLFTGRSGLKGAGAGALIGAAAGDAGKGAAIGAAVGIVGRGVKENRDERANAAAAAAVQSRTVNVANANGSFTPVTLVLVQQGWQAPNGEIYSTLPTSEQLLSTYGTQ